MLGQGWERTQDFIRGRKACAAGSIERVFQPTKARWAERAHPRGAMWSSPPWRNTSSAPGWLLSVWQRRRRLRRSREGNELRAPPPGACLCRPLLAATWNAAAINYSAASVLRGAVGVARDKFAALVAFFCNSGMAFRKRADAPLTWTSGPWRSLSSTSPACSLRARDGRSSGCAAIGLVARGP